MALVLLPVSYFSMPVSSFSASGTQLNRIFCSQLCHALVNSIRAFLTSLLHVRISKDLKRICMLLSKKKGAVTLTVRREEFLIYHFGLLQCAFNSNFLVIRLGLL